MKRTLISIAIASVAGVSGQVYAQALTPAQALAAPNQLFLSGATAPSGTIRNTIKTNVNLCNGTSSEFRDAATRWVAIGCTIGGTATVIHYAILGSNFGVNPVLKGGVGLPTPKLDLATCPNQGSATNQTCTGIQAPGASVAPDVGISDIRPDAFVLNNVPSAAVLDREFNPAFAAVGAGTISGYGALYAGLQAPNAAADNVSPAVISPTYGLTFSIAMSNPLATALGGAANSLPFGIGATQSLTKTQITAILGTTLANSTQVLATLGIPAPATATKFAICTRPSTSGTKAWANQYFLGTNPPRPENAIVGTAGNWTDNVGGGVTRTLATVENVTSGDVRNCLNQASAQGIPAIGIISRENGNEPLAVNSGVTNNFSFARINQVASDSAASGDRATTRTGLYDNVGEATFNRRGPLSAAQTTILTALSNDLRGAVGCAASRAITTFPDTIAGNASGCETVWSRGGNPFALPVNRE